MKKISIIRTIVKHLIVLRSCSLTVLIFLCGCNDFLEQEPLSAISPEKYFTDESHLAAYTNGLYPDILPSGVRAEADYYTDNHAAVNFSSRYVPGEWKLGQDGGDWSIGRIYNCNYFLSLVLPKHEAGKITGSANNIKHYIGEVYFLRAYSYFSKYQLLGDFPIVTEPLPDDLDILTEASKRAPRNEVARFILSDLDKAIELMATSPDARKTRASKESALLLKSRVALYEGTFLKYFRGTAFVPNGTGWTGAAKDYHSGYQYPSGNIDNEINFFLEEAIDAAQRLASTVVLTANTGKVQQDAGEAANPYMDMYASIDLSKYEEVLLWREYNRGLGITNNMAEWAKGGNRSNGLTKGLIDCYLMSNGLPVYAAGSGYHGDDYIADIRKDRDNRLFLFLKEPGQRNTVFGGGSYFATEPSPPNITGAYGTDISRIYNTGYATRKGNPLDGVHSQGGGGNDSFTGIVIFRGVEALLNYVEAYYERHGTLNATALQYWQAIRSRAKVDTNVQKTIDATDMARETGDWGAYSAGNLIDATLYNIRRERRCELMAEGLRAMDIQRWRACDQMIETPYHIEGMKIWGPVQELYKNASGVSSLRYGLDLPAAVVSPPDRSDYLRPYEKARNSLALDGFRWRMAHYLNPIALQHILITSKDNDVATSPIYQNPGWTLVVGEGAEY